MQIDHESLIRMLEAEGGQDVHNTRYAQSIMYLACNVPQLASNTPINIYEVGWPTHFSRVLTKLYPNVRIIYSSSDIRYAFQLDIPKVDVVLCMEVMEHLSDIPSNDIGITSTFTESGMDGFLQNLKQYLDENTLIFITTPCIVNLLAGVHPFAYKPHHREMTPMDVKRILEKNGYNVLHLETKNVWNHHGLSSRYIQMVQQVIKQFGFSRELREDDIFALAKLKL